MKYFIAKATGVTLAVDENKTLGKGKLLAAYEGNENYIPCDKDGKPLKAAAPKADAKAETPKAEEKPAEAPKADAKK